MNSHDQTHLVGGSLQGNIAIVAVHACGRRLNRHKHQALAPIGAHTAIVTLCDAARR